jgi:hypothetical protein
MAVFAANLVIPQGTDFEQSFNLFNEDGSHLVLTGCAVTAKLRKYYGSVGVTTFTSSIVNPTQGGIKISLNETQTANLTVGRHYYDVLVTSGSSITSKVIEGMILVEGTASL